MSVTYLYHPIFRQCLWHIYIIKYSNNICDIVRKIRYSDNVCDISVSWNNLTMSVTYLYHQIFRQFLWHIYILRYSDNGGDMSVSVTEIEQFQIWVPAIPPHIYSGGIAGTQIWNGSKSLTMVKKRKWLKN